MSWQAQGWAWTITGVSPMAKLVALSLANHADPYGGNIRPGMPLVQRETCASEQSVRRAIAELIAAGWLELVSASTGRGHATEYRMPVDMQKVAAAYPKRVPGSELEPEKRVPNNGERVPNEEIKGAKLQDKGCQGGTPAYIQPKKEEPKYNLTDSSGPAAPDVNEGADLFKAPSSPPLKAPKLTVTKAMVEYDESFKRWYARYPRKESPKDALKAYAQAIVNDGATPDQLWQALERQRDGLLEREVRYRPLPASWLRAGSWANGPVEGPKGGSGSRMVGGL